MLDKEKRISHTHTHTHKNLISHSHVLERQSPHATDDQMGWVLRERVQPNSCHCLKAEKARTCGQCLSWGQVEYTKRSCKGITLVLWMSLALSHRKVNGVICSNSKPYHIGAYHSLFVGILKQPESKVLKFAVQVNIPLIQSQKQRRQRWD